MFLLFDEGYLYQENPITGGGGGGGGGGEGVD